MIRTRRTVLLTAVAALMLPFPAFAQAPEVTLEIWQRLNGANGETFAKVVSRFEEANPGVKVNVTQRGWEELFTSAIAAVRSGTQPDVLMVNETTVLSMMDSGAIIPVQDLLEANGVDIDWSDYIPAMRNWYETKDGRLLSMPFNSSTPVMYYNTDMLDAHGIDTASLPRTWDEFEALLTTLKQKGVACGYAMRNDPWVHVENYSLSNGIPYASAENGFDGYSARLEINNEKVVSHVSRVKAWLDGAMARYVSNDDEFASGTCAILGASSARQGSLDAVDGLNYVARTVPVEAGVTPQNAAVGGGSFWALKGGTEAELKAVAAFFAYIARSDVQAMFASETGYVPITRTAAKLLKDEGYYDKNPNAMAQLEQLDRIQEGGSRGLRLSNYPEIRAIITEEMEAAYSGKKTVQAALDAAVERGNVQLERFERQSAGKK